MSQLVLPLRLADHAVFASFLDAGNETLVATLAGLRRVDGGQGCWLWGAAATGKTHLLQAVCDRAGTDRSTCRSRWWQRRARDSRRTGRRDLVCIDDVDQVAGDEALGTGAVSGLFNELQEDGGQLIVVCGGRGPA